MSGETADSEKPSGTCRMWCRPRAAPSMALIGFCAKSSTPSETIEIYCVKCKAKTASKDIEAITMKNGRPATRSVCVECGTKKFRIGVLP